MILGIPSVEKKTRSLVRHVYQQDPDQKWRMRLSGAMSWGSQVEKFEDNRYHIDGSPATCVNIGLYQLAPDCDFVISGPNIGHNVGRCAAQDVARHALTRAGRHISTLFATKPCQVLAASSSKCRTQFFTMLEQFHHVARHSLLVGLDRPQLGDCPAPCLLSHCAAVNYSVDCLELNPPPPSA